MKKNTEEDQKKYGWYGLFYIDLVLSGKILEGTASLVSTNHERSLEGTVGNEFGLQIKAGVEAGAKVLWVSGQLMAEADNFTAIKSKLVFNQKGVGVEFRHEGIRSHFSITVKGEAATQPTNGIELSNRFQGKRTSSEAGYELLNVDVEWAQKDSFGPYYFINS